MKISDKAKILNEVIDENSNGIIITDRNGNIEYVNPRQCEKSGYSQAELIGQNASIFQSGETPVSVYDSMWTTILAGNVWQGELLNKRKNGELYWEYLHVSPVINNKGNISHFLAIKEERLHKFFDGLTDHGLSRIDPLTGLLNRPAFNQHLLDAINKAESVPKIETITLIYIKLDNFHVFDQGEGFLNQDKIIVETAKRLRQCLRQNDITARIGVDEFAVFWIDTYKDKIDTGSIERILSEIRQPIIINELELSACASIGIACYPGDSRSGDHLIEKARSAMKEAQKSGGNIFHIHEASAAGAIHDYPDMASDLRNAIQCNEFELHYQPQVNLTSGEIVGLEALIRWRRQSSELIAPNVFIPFAEQSDLIIKIGEWVLHEATSQIINWREAKLPSIKIAINLSAKHFHKSYLPDFISELLVSRKIEASLLELELTENAVLLNPPKVKQNIEQLKALGVQISLDDFGTGQSSLVWLSQLPVDQIKIDKSFVSDVTTNPVNASIVAATIAMAKKLDKNVIAEGVETEAQLQFIRRQGCDFMQGYLFSKPRTADEISAMLKENRRLKLKSLLQEDGQFSLLLVDDEPQIVRVLQRVFQRENYTIYTANSGEEALEMLAVNPIQIVISDHHMPGMTGVEFLSRVKKLYPDTIRIILSGQSNLSTIIEAINRGAIWKYFAKPLETDLLRQSVRKACQQIIMKQDEEAG